MRHVVVLEQRVERTVIVNADSFEELEQKIRDNDVEKDWRRIRSLHYYGEWAYHTSYSVKEGESLITCADDLVRFYGGTNACELERLVKEHTHLIFRLSWNDDLIKFEGDIGDAYYDKDFEVPVRYLEFPFTIDTYTSAVSELERQAHIIWELWHEE